MTSRLLLGRWIAAAWSVGAVLGLAPTASSAAPGCDAIIYFDVNFGGESREVYDDERFVGPHWNDQMSSIRILAGNWIFYRDADYSGDVLRFGPGTYPTLPPQWNDQISSFQCVAGTGGGGPGPDGGSSGDDTYFYQGQTYGWYEDGWNGAGFYVVGLQRVRGRGFGGREGDHGWHHHDRRDHDRGHDHDHDHGHHGGGGRHDGPRPHDPLPGHPPRLPFHTPNRLRSGGFHPPPHPHGDGHPGPHPHAGGHPPPHPHSGGHPGGHHH